MSVLAKECGINGRGPAKIHRRLNIPYLRRRYCAREAPGNRVVINKLLEPGDNTPFQRKDRWVRDCVTNHPPERKALCEKSKPMRPVEAMVGGLQP